MDQKIVDANILVHTAMAATYDANEPHFRPENKAVVRRQLENLRAKTGPRLLDVGCGTGFIIGLAKDLFAEIHGVDITQAMLDRVDRSGGNVTLHRSVAEKTPFPDNHFDAASAYSFIHHLTDYAEVLKEVHRVLKPGGAFYIDLDPNKLFWQAMAAAEKSAGLDQPSDIVQREIASVMHTDDRVEQEFGIPTQTFNLAENYKDLQGGIDGAELRAAALAIGYRSCEVGYYWYLGQGAVLHGQSAGDAATVEAYLLRALPASAPLFKYVRFLLVK
jgi:ubiquinone/menaquinone biosynthesis C-methylase UbiE